MVTSQSCFGSDFGRVWPWSPVKRLCHKCMVHHGPPGSKLQAWSNFSHVSVFCIKGWCDLRSCGTLVLSGCNIDHTGHTQGTPRFQWLQGFQGSGSIRNLMESIRPVADTLLLGWSMVWSSLNSAPTWVMAKIVAMAVLKYMHCVTPVKNLWILESGETTSHKKDPSHVIFSVRTILQWVIIGTHHLQQKVHIGSLVTWHEETCASSTTSWCVFVQWICLSWCINVFLFAYPVSSWKIRHYCGTTLAGSLPRYIIHSGTAVDPWHCKWGTSQHCLEHWLAISIDWNGEKRREWENEEGTSRKSRGGNLEMSGNFGNVWKCHRSAPRSNRLAWTLRRTAKRPEPGMKRYGECVLPPAQLSDILRHRIFVTYNVLPS